MGNEERIEEIFNRLNSVAETDLTIELVHDTRTINAWIQGTQISVTEALADLLEDDELAFVIAHEICHSLRGHAYRKHKVSSFFALMVKEALDDTRYEFWDRALVAGLWIGGELVVGRFVSRMHEFESDDMAYQLASDAGYDAEAAIEFFRKLGPGGGGILGTHPSNAKRIRRLGAGHSKRYTYVPLPTGDDREQEEEEEESPDGMDKTGEDSSLEEDEIYCYGCGKLFDSHEKIHVCLDCREDICTDCWEDQWQGYCSNCAGYHSEEDIETRSSFCDWCKGDVDEDYEEVVICPDCKDFYCIECWTEDYDGFCKRCAAKHTGEQHDECCCCGNEIGAEDFLRICPDCRGDFCEDCWSDSYAGYCTDCQEASEEPDDEQ